MTFLDKLLGRKPKNENLHASTAAPTLAEAPPQELFTETLPPVEDPAPAAGRAPRVRYRPAHISDFLSEDFWGQGYRHAQQFPSGDRRDSALKLLRANYRQVLDKAAQLVSADLEAHEQEILRFKGVSDVLDAQLTRRKSELEILLNRVDNQLELSVDDEGWLAPAIAAYSDGFKQGAMEYMQHNELLSGISVMR